MLTIVSGPDGSGKSTIINAYAEVLSKEEIKVKVCWLRFVSLFSKIVNMFGRLFKKSYVEKYEWGDIGYHDYSGSLGFVYIISCYIDHILYYPIFHFKNRKAIKSQTIHHIYDRYLVDTVADLIVDTGKEKFILWLFTGLVTNLKIKAKVVIITCDEKIVVSRRDDILDDKKYKLRIFAFKKIASTYNITTLDTTKGSINENIVGLYGKL